MHGLCAKAKHSRFAGTSTERDFVECPSQVRGRGEQGRRGGGEEWKGTARRSVYSPTDK